MSATSYQKLDDQIFEKLESADDICLLKSVVDIIQPQTLTEIMSATSLQNWMIKYLNGF
jgi:hypothetical protein